MFAIYQVIFFACTGSPQIMTGCLMAAQLPRVSSEVLRTHFQSYDGYTHAHITVPGALGSPLQPRDYDL